MRPWLISLIALSLCTSPAFAQGKVLLDTWDAAYLGDGKAGYVHTLAREIDHDGTKLIHTTIELRLRVKRFDGVVEMAMDTGTIETKAGKVVGTVTKQYFGKQLQNQVDGVVVGKKLELTQNGKIPLKPAPWNPEVIGLYKQQALYKDRNPMPGDKLSFLTFEPSINLVIKVEANVKGYQEVLLKGSKQKTKLLLVEQVPDKVESNGNKVQLPLMLVWLDEKLEPVKSQSEIPGLSRITLQRSTKAQATAPIPVDELTDISTGQLVRLKNRILNPYDTTAAVYRLTIRDDDNVATTFSRDARQQVKNVRGNTFELNVKASKGLNGEASQNEPAAEFLQSSYFINSSDTKVIELARKAVGAETDPWKKALAVERWVHANMKVTPDEALAPADHVARTLEGDCTEYSMLAAAMCRAVGVPSRTAIGLIYADVKGAPCFAFHMWTEVWISGRWIPIDATLGKGYVGATHLKITDHSWHDERTMTPLFPVIRVVGRVNIEVLSVERR